MQVTKFIWNEIIGNVNQTYMYKPLYQKITTNHRSTSRHTKEKSNQKLISKDKHQITRGEENTRGRGKNV